MKKDVFLLIFCTLVLLEGNLYSQRLTFGVKAGLGSTGLLGGISSNPLFDSNSLNITFTLGLSILILIIIA